MASGLAAAAAACAAALLIAFGAYAFTHSEGNGSVTYDSVDSIDGLELEYVSGTPGACSLFSNSYGEYTVRFGALSESSVYSLSGTLRGNITVDTGGSDLELRLGGLDVSSMRFSPLSADSCGTLTISLSEGTANRMSDFRAEEDSAFAVLSSSDVIVAGNGSLAVESTKNGGISVSGGLGFTGASVSVKSSSDALVSHGDISVSDSVLQAESRSGAGLSAAGNQASIGISGSAVSVFASAAGIRADGDVSVSGDSDVSVFTSDMSALPDHSKIFVGYASADYRFSLKTETPDGTEWVNPSGEPVLVRSAMAKSYVYEFEVADNVESIVIYAYSSGQVQGQDSSYHAKSSPIQVGFQRNSFLITQCAKGMGIMYKPADYGGPGAADREESATAGIRAGGDIGIEDGKVFVKSEGPAIFSAGGNVSVAGDVTAFSRSDVIKAAGSASIEGGKSVLYTQGIGCSAINAASGYSYASGYALAVGPYSEASRSGMENADGFSSFASESSVSMRSGSYIEADIGGTAACVFAVPDISPGASQGNHVPPGPKPQSDPQSGGEMQQPVPQPGRESPEGERQEQLAVFIGSSSVSFSVKTSASYQTDSNGVYWGLSKSL